MSSDNTKQQPASIIITSTVTPPDRFVGMHAHSVSSLADGMGLPKEHFDYVHENGGDALCITDHGNMNVLAHAYGAAEEMKKKGKQFKYVPSLEAYFVDSLPAWREFNEQEKQRVRDDKRAKIQEVLEKKARIAEKKKKSDEKKALKNGSAPAISKEEEAFNEEVGNEFAGIKDEIAEFVKTDDDEAVDDEDDDVGSVSENEEESKNGSLLSPLKQRNHLVLLPKNNAGLKALFKLVSRSYKEGAFRGFPRIDYEMLREHSGGNLIASSACIAGKYAREVMKAMPQDVSWEQWDHNTPHDFEKVQENMRIELNKFIEAMHGEENVYLELQHNAMKIQHLVNKHLIELSKRTGVKLVSAADSHYARPELWREREILKAMAWMVKSKDKDLLSKIPKTVDELKCELYPKNAQQMWESYHKYKTPDMTFYDDQVVKESIERTHDIVHQQIGEITMDKKVKLPSVTKFATTEEINQIKKEYKEKKNIDATEDDVMYRLLVLKCKDGMQKKNLHSNKEYVDRLSYELSVIKHLGLSSYFVTYATFMQMLWENMLVGASRGSAGGSLVCYVIEVTNIDPIKHGLLFERFLSKHKKGIADVDCVSNYTHVRMPIAKHTKPIGELKPGEIILDMNNQEQAVLFVVTRKVTDQDRIFDICVDCSGTKGVVVCTSKHRWFLEDGSCVEASQLRSGSKLFGGNVVLSMYEKTPLEKQKLEVTDITVTGTSSFQVVPFDVALISTRPFGWMGKASFTQVKPLSVYGTMSVDPNVPVHSCYTDGKWLASHNSDVSDREKAFKLITNMFGEESVIPVSLFAQLQLRSLVKDLGRLNGMDDKELGKVTKRIEIETLAEKKKEDGFDRGVWEMTYEEAHKYSPTFRDFMEKNPEMEVIIKRLYKNFRSVGRHAGGVVITENASDNMPLIKSKDVIQTPWTEGVNFRHLEQFGFLKFDVLGLGTLAMFEKCISKILQKERDIKKPTFKQIKEYYNTNLNPANIELDDLKVFEHVFHQGNYLGIFQFVKPNTQAFMKKMKPTSLNDIATVTSCYRPGPLSLSIDKKLLENKLNPDKVKYEHPLLKECLQETYGCLLYQEELQMIYHKMAGVPLDETDSVRKAFTKKEIANKAKAAEDRNKLRGEFLRLCKENNNIEEAITGPIFDNMEKLVAYSFNKSHAMGYSMATYQCCWFLTYHPDEWVSSYLDYSTHGKGKLTGKEDPKVTALKEAKRLGYATVKPDINHSDIGFAAKTFTDTHKKEIFPGLSSMKGVNRKAIHELISLRPFNSFWDVFVDANGLWKPKEVDKTTIDALIRLEAFGSVPDAVGEGEECVFKTYAEMHDVLIKNWDKMRQVSRRKKNNNVKTFIEELLVANRAERLKPRKFSMLERQTSFEELLGIVPAEVSYGEHRMRAMKDMVENFSKGLPKKDKYILAEDMPDLHLFFDYEEREFLPEKTTREDPVYNIVGIISSAEPAIAKTGKEYWKTTVYVGGQVIPCNMFNIDSDVPTKNSIVLMTVQLTKFGLNLKWGTKPTFIPELPDTDEDDSVSGEQETTVDDDSVESDDD